MRLLALFLSCVALSAADIVGSDLLAGAVARGLDTAAGKTAADFGGTLPGRQAFVDGRAGAAVLMMPVSVDAGFQRRKCSPRMRLISAKAKG